MGIRFYRGIRLGKLARVNVSKSGLGLSLGVRGLRVSSGPSGTFLTLGLPGTGLSYRKKVGKGGGIGWPNFKGVFSRDDGSKEKAPKLIAAEEAEPVPPKPEHEMTPAEKRLVEGLTYYRQNQTKEALDVFLSLSREEPSAAVLAAAILANTDTNAPTAERLLERVLQVDEEGEFPTPLMQAYLSDMEIQIEVTPSVAVSTPIDVISVSLLLVEMYQAQEKMDEALGLLEELDELTEGKFEVITLSLCELYAIAGLWDGIIDRAQSVQETEDDVTLEIMLFYGRALQEKGLDEAAISIFGKALRRTKDRNPALLHEARYWRAWSYERTGKRQRANEEYQKLFAEAPGFRDVAAKLGV
jgi:tetratricopeptide (TPR) repeat protein